MSTTLTVLRQRVLEGINDYISVAVTTAIAGDTSIISTNLNEYDGGADDTFNDWYVYITDEKNIGVERQISNYATTGGTITVRGSNLTAEDAAEIATIWVCRHSILQIVDKAINRTIEEIFPALHRRIDDLTLVTGNALPNAHFQDWAITTTPDHYTAPTGSVAATETVAYIRGGAKSAYLTASGTPDYFYITSNDYPRLLDLMGQTINFYAWAYPVDTADDAAIQIYTLQADLTSQTLTSSTSNPITKWSLLKLESQTLNDNLTEIQFRFRVKTTTKHAYFDDAIVCGMHLYEYLLPESLQNGYVNQVYSQTEGYSDVPAYDIHPRQWEKEGFRVIDNGSYKYLLLDNLPVSYRRLRMLGVSPLEALRPVSATIDDSISIDASGRTDLLVAYATYLLYEMAESPISSEDSARFERESAKRYAKYIRLLRKHRMISPSGTLRV